MVTHNTPQKAGKISVKYGNNSVAKLSIDERETFPFV